MLADRARFLLHNKLAIEAFNVFDGSKTGIRLQTIDGLHLSGIDVSQGTATDAAGNTSKFSAPFADITTNQPPSSAEVGGPYLVAVGQTITHDVSGTDPDGDPPTFDDA